MLKSGNVFRRILTRRLLYVLLMARVRLVVIVSAFATLVPVQSRLMYAERL